MVGGWLGLVVGWPEVYWHGQLTRVAAALPQIDKMATKLAANWPRSDGELTQIGSFLAYPKSDPRSLLLLGIAIIPGTDLQFSAVERSADGTIRFELSGRETGAWVELRNDDNDPQAFVGGLETSYRVARWQRLSARWFLVRYRS
jgi:hypothetical protein